VSVHSAYYLFDISRGFLPFQNHVIFECFFLFIRKFELIQMQVDQLHKIFLDFFGHTSCQQNGRNLFIVPEFVVGYFLWSRSQNLLDGWSDRVLFPATRVRTLECCELVLTIAQYDGDVECDLSVVGSFGEVGGECDDYVAHAVRLHVLQQAGLLPSRWLHTFALNRFLQFILQNCLLWVIHFFKWVY